MAKFAMNVIHVTEDYGVHVFGTNDTEDIDKYMAQNGIDPGDGAIVVIHNTYGQRQTFGEEPEEIEDIASQLSEGTDDSDGEENEDD